MKQSAKINITAAQNGEKIEIITEGLVEILPDTATIEYEVENNKTLISLTGNLVSVTKFSDPAYTMVFSTGLTPEPFQIIYPGGTMYLKSKPKKVLLKKEENKIDIYLSYSLQYESDYNIEHKLRIICNY